MVKVYHVAPRRVLPQITNEGLVPRNPEGRVYFFTDFTDAKIYASRVERMHNERFAILEVVVGSAQLHKDLTLFVDDPTTKRNEAATAVYLKGSVPAPMILMRDLRRKSQTADRSFFYRRPEVRVRSHRRRR